ncbi:SPOSA6832_04620 [Sporobolomyces salmonicolor]|uniref:ubiquitinyl hydrolase 1 n=1 Tax=Sporidiobolus salmonicolor TaxID=5005 RepID=A0A0D6ESH1_SPOSA|nr:SPOSA6832_04620 [Sporobolomyces salmonicolor]
MPPFPIKVKHAGKTYDVSDFDPSAPATVFKSQIHQLTGVDPAKVKVVVKGGMLKDDADMNKLGFKAGQTIMVSPPLCALSLRRSPPPSLAQQVIGPAGPIPQAPPKPIVFMEDMSDAELAQAAQYPVGLQNLAPQPDVQLTRSLRDLYQDMGRTTEGFPPFAFLNMLRQFAPQFAERSRQTGQYAQQDAQEAWGAIVQAAKSSLSSSSAVGGGEAAESGRFVERYLMGELEKTLKSAEAPDEPATTTREPFLELKCNIGGSTNYMLQGLSEAMEQDIEKTSPTLGREAVYRETTRVARLPSYLTVNMVRFYWRRDISKKTKIMRKVKFPFDLDAIDLVSDELKKKILPVNERLKDIEKERRERAKARRKSKKQQAEAAAASSTSSTPASAAAERQTPTDDPPERMLVDGELPDEHAARQTELATLLSLVHPDLEADPGANASGLYELVGVDDEDVDPDQQQWYKFDDDKVSLVSRDKILALEGGGEDHCAYILLYKSKSLA